MNQENPVVIETLPSTPEDVDALKLDALIKLVQDLTTPGTVIWGHAAMNCNQFLSLAAVRMVKEYLRREIDLARAIEGTNREIIAIRHEFESFKQACRTDG